MKRFLFLAILAAAFASRAEYLFWQVSDTTLSSDVYLKEKVNLSDGYTYKSIMHYGTGDMDAGTWSEAGTLGDAKGGVVGGDGTIDTAYNVNLSDLSGASGYSYYIEIVKYDGAGAQYGVAKSETQTYTQLANANYVGDILSPAALVPWTGGAYSAPEPSSAMLVLVGMALVALKRKRA